MHPKMLASVTEVLILIDLSCPLNETGVTFYLFSLDILYIECQWEIGVSDIEEVISRFKLIMLFRVRYIRVMAFNQMPHLEGTEHQCNCYHQQRAAEAQTRPNGLTPFDIESKDSSGEKIVSIY